ncbi:MAG TPA: hypothetical protein VHE30_13165 [Polyangiaceae bacterium]|nr:hypothetical protein [Polyangiaceae bacterium]
MGAPDSPNPAPRTPGAVTLLVLLGSLALALFASVATGPTFDEERRVAAARHAIDLARAFGQFGPSTMVSSSARGVYDDLAPFGIVPGLVSGWLGEVLRAAHLLDGLTAARFGWLLVAGLAPFALFLLVAESRGPRTGFLAAALLVSMPRFSHALGAAREPAIVTSAWLLVLAAYRWSLPPSFAARRAGLRRRHRLAALLFSVAVAFGMAVDLATLWILPVVVGHYAATHRRLVRPALRRGRVPLPSGFVWLLVLTPALIGLFVPSLWRGGAVSGAEWLFSPLTPTIEPLLYGAPVVAYKDVPSSYAVHWLLVTTPLSTLLLFVAGVVVAARDALRVRRGDARRDPAALVGLCLFMVVAVSVGPALAPRVLTRFPPRLEAALPFVAVLAALALDRAATRLIRDARAAGRALILAGLAAAAFGLRELPTAAASFNLLAGGTKGAVRAKVFTIGDGSEVAPLAKAIDALHLGGIAPPSGDVSRAYWTLLSQTGRLATPVGSGVALTATRGERTNAVATVVRDGVVLWSLTRR